MTSVFWSVSEFLTLIVTAIFRRGCEVGIHSAKEDSAALAEEPARFLSARTGSVSGTMSIAK